MMSRVGLRGSREDAATVEERKSGGVKQTSRARESGREVEW
jgi:hypothetical protein